MKSDQQFGILFVCSGNSCRSPMAEGILKAILPTALKQNVTVQSAGTLGIHGSPATDFAVEVARDHGADIAGHRSQGITEKLVKSSDLIFAMAEDHKHYLQDRFPGFRENVFLLRAFDRAPGEITNESIADPIGQSLEVYRECGELIHSELQRIMPRLQQLITEKLESS